VCVCKYLCGRLCVGECLSVSVSLFVCVRASFSLSVQKLVCVARTHFLALSLSLLWFPSSLLLLLSFCIFLCKIVFLVWKERVCSFLCVSVYCILPSAFVLSFSFILEFCAHALYQFLALPCLPVSCTSLSPTLSRDQNYCSLGVCPDLLCKFANTWSE